MRVCIVIPQKPEPRREPLHGTRGTYPHPRNTLWYKTVRAAWTLAGEPRVRGPIELSLIAEFPRPKHHWMKNGQLSAAGRRMLEHETTPDLSNIVKALEDALEGHLFEDDRQIVSYGQPFRKQWAGRPDDHGRLVVWFEELGRTL